MSDPLVDQSPATGFQYSAEGTDVAELLAMADTSIQQSANVTAIAALTQSEYDALSPKSATTLYITT